MNSERLYRQLTESIDRLIQTSLSVSQSYPSMVRDSSYITIGKLKGINNSIALKDISYEDIYNDMNTSGGYHVKLIDGALLSFQYQFELIQDKEVLRKHRLIFMPSPLLPLYDDYDDDYGSNDFFLELCKKNLVHFPIRFDFDPENSSDYHPKSHLTLGQYENCRIPVSMPVSPRKFILFVIINFYHRAYIKNKNIFDKKMISLIPVHTLTDNDKTLSHIMI